MVHKFTAHTTHQAHALRLPIWEYIEQSGSFERERRLTQGKLAIPISSLQRFVISILSRKYNYNVHVASHSITQHHTASYSITQHPQHHAASHSITQHHTASYSIIQHHTASRSTTQHRPASPSITPPNITMHQTISL